MYRKFIIALAASLSLGAYADTPQTDETSITVTWQNPSKFTDIRTENLSQKGFEERTFKRFETFFAELQKEMPSGHTLEITVTDLDLAGKVMPKNFNQSDPYSLRYQRISKSTLLPSISFSYVLRDHGKDVKAADVELEYDGLVLRSADERRRFTPIRLEKRMLRAWFESEFSETLANN